MKKLLLPSWDLSAATTLKEVFRIPVAGVGKGNEVETLFYDIENPSEQLHKIVKGIMLSMWAQNIHLLIVFLHTSIAYLARMYSN